MPGEFRNKSVVELQEALDLGVDSQAKLTALLQSKTITKASEMMVGLGQDITDFRKVFKDKMEILEVQINKIISSSDKMFWASIIYFIGTLLLTGAIAFSALVQAGIILKK